MSDGHRTVSALPAAGVAAAKRFIAEQLAE
jgi:hypothetical protein